LIYPAPREAEHGRREFIDKQRRHVAKLLRNLPFRSELERQHDPGPDSD
jgi:hypothetical protein